MRQDRLVCIETGDGLDDRSSILDSGQDFSLRHHVETSSGAHPASYPTGTGCSLFEGKAAEVLS
jgi:hypothetical protein